MTPWKRPFCCLATNPSVHLVRFWERKAWEAVQLCEDCLIFFGHNSPGHGAGLRGDISGCSLHAGDWQRLTPMYRVNSSRYWEWYQHCCPRYGAGCRLTKIHPIDQIGPTLQRSEVPHLVPLCIAPSQTALFSYIHCSWYQEGTHAEVQHDYKLVYMVWPRNFKTFLGPALVDAQSKSNLLRYDEQRKKLLDHINTPYIHNRRQYYVAVLPVVPNC